jgi:hypothetical protein
MNELALKKRARAAFWQGRLREAQSAMALAALLVAAAVLLSGEPAMSFASGALLLVLTGAFAFLGREAGRAVVPAMVLGALPLSCALLAPHLGHVCTGSGCVSLCAPLCASGGSVSGILLARFARAQPHPARTWLFGGSVALAAGAVGCVCAGLPSLLGMAAGLTLPSVVAALVPARATS